MKTSQWGMTIACLLLSVSARAQDLEASSSTPTVGFNDTDTDPTCCEWSFIGYGDSNGGEPNNAIGLFDQLGANDHPVIAVNGEPGLSDNELAFIIDANGDTFLSGGAVSIRKDEQVLSIGGEGTNPGPGLTIANKQFPGITLEDSTNVNQFTLFSGEGTSLIFGTDTDGMGGADPTFPMSISMGAPNATLRLSPFGNVGMGTNLPMAALHVVRNDGTAQVRVTEFGEAAPRTLFQLINPGNTKFGVRNSEANTEWAFANPGDAFRLSLQDSGVVEMEINSAGNLTIAGNLIENSDRDAKTAFEPIDATEVLAKIESLPIQKWEYKDSPGEPHIGPVAQDFYQAFELGGTSRGIAGIDTSGVALAAIQALSAKVNEQASEIDELKSALAEQQARTELMVSTLGAQLQAVQAALDAQSVAVPQVVLADAR